MKKILLAGAMPLGLGLIGIATTANAALIFNLGGGDFSYDSGGSNGADLPYNALTLTFENTLTDTVKLTINASGMPNNTGKISDVWFNVADSFAFDDLKFDHESGVATDDIIEGKNIFSPVGTFDINFEYKTSGPLGHLYFGRTSVYIITGTDLDENDFNAPSTGGYNALMHMNITGNGKSGHYVPTPVPEPATMFLFGTGLVGLATIRRKNKK